MVNHKSDMCVQLINKLNKLGWSFLENIENKSTDKVYIFEYPGIYYDIHVEIKFNEKFGKWTFYSETIVNKYESEGAELNFEELSVFVTLMNELSSFTKTN